MNGRGKQELEKTPEIFMFSFVHHSSLIVHRFFFFIALMVLPMCAFASIDAVIEEAIEQKAFPGAAVVVLRDEKIVYAKAFGKITYESEIPVALDTLFDLASLTKPLVTAACIHKLVEAGKISLDDSLSRYFPDVRPEIKMHHLLSHQSGLPADIPPWFKDEHFLSLERKEQIDKVWNYIFAEAKRAEPGKKMLYSDLGFLLLGKVVERVSGVSLDCFFEEQFIEPLALTRTTFCPRDKGYPLEKMAPTELDTCWRLGIVHGTVHDEKAALLGGIAGNAGLFASALDLAKLVALFQSFSLGWSQEMPSLEGISFSPSAFGHLGFTGTSIWIDPDRKLSIVFLTNRVYPTRDNIQIRKVRKKLAQEILQWVELI